MLQPTRTNYRKVQKGRNEGLSWSGAAVSFGEFGLKATTRGELTARQIEAARRSSSGLHCGPSGPSCIWFAWVAAWLIPHLGDRGARSLRSGRSSVFSWAIWV